MLDQNQNVVTSEEDALKRANQLRRWLVAKGDKRFTLQNLARRVLLEAAATIDNPES